MNAQVNSIDPGFPTPQVAAAPATRIAGPGSGKAGERSQEPIVPERSWPHDCYPLRP